MQDYLMKRRVAAMCLENELKNRIDTASGREKASLVLKKCRIINVFSCEIIEGDIAIEEGKVAGIGDYHGECEINIDGRYVSPGFIDGHVHIESSMVTPLQYARAVLPKGTTAVIADPHEIANVCGLKGIQYMLKASEGLPIDIYIMLPSCVPSTVFESAGAVLPAEMLKTLLGHKKVLGMGEMMDYPGVIAARSENIKKIAAADNFIIDGHGPNIKDRDLNAYAAAGIKTEHECSTADEMIERLRLGMYVLIREGSAAKNLKALIKGVNRENSRRCLFCTDDKHPEDIMRGHIDNNLRLAVNEGLDPVTAIQMATLNAAECYGLKNKGAVAPGFDADLVVLEDLKEFKARQVYKNGKLAAENGVPLFEANAFDYSDVKGTVNIKPLTEKSLEIRLDTDVVNVIKLIPNSILTQRVTRKVHTEEGIFQYHKSLDILKLAVIERHNATGNVGLGLVEDYQLKNGAIASTIAHDSHNIIVIGKDDKDMLLAVNEVARIGGGICICSGGRVLYTLPLPIAGLITQKPMEDVAARLSEMIEIARTKLGVNPQIDPFMTLSFLALPVIPELKLTDMGLFDVGRFDFTSLTVKE
jgi:adenine deaminase